MRPSIAPLIARLRQTFLHPLFPDPRTRPQSWRHNRKFQSVVSFVRSASPMTPHHGRESGLSG